MNSEFKRFRTEHFRTVVHLCQDNGQRKDAQKDTRIKI
jgi:hypothetical protein